MYLETKRLIIRDYEESDRDNYFRLKSDSLFGIVVPNENEAINIHCGWLVNILLSNI